MRVFGEVGITLAKTTQDSASVLDITDYTVYFSILHVNQVHLNTLKLSYNYGIFANVDQKLWRSLLCHLRMNVFDELLTTFRHSFCWLL